MKDLDSALKTFDAIMAMVFTLSGMIIWNVGIWKEDHSRKIYGLVLVLVGYIVFRH